MISSGVGPPRGHLNHGRPLTTAIGKPALADAILDRLVHNSNKITLKGESMCKWLAKSDGSRPPRTDD